LLLTVKSLYKWKNPFSKPAKKRQEEQDLQAENARLKRELKRALQEPVILNSIAAR